MTCWQARQDFRAIKTEQTRMGRRHRTLVLKANIMLLNLITVILLLQQFVGSDLHWELQNGWFCHSILKGIVQFQDIDWFLQLQSSHRNLAISLEINAITQHEQFHAHPMPNKMHWHMNVKTTCSFNTSLHGAYAA